VGVSAGKMARILAGIIPVFDKLFDGLSDAPHFTNMHGQISWIKASRLAGILTGHQTSLRYGI
jgi:hypothetical protein